MSTAAVYAKIEALHETTDYLGRLRIEGPAAFPHKATAAQDYARLRKDEAINRKIMLVAFAHDLMHSLAGSYFSAMLDRIAATRDVHGDDLRVLWREGFANAKKTNDPRVLAVCNKLAGLLKVVIEAPYDGPSTYVHAAAPPSSAPASTPTPAPASAPVPALPSGVRVRGVQITAEVRAALLSGAVSGDLFTMPKTERALYLRVVKVLSALNVKWNTKRQGFVVWPSFLGDLHGTVAAGVAVDVDRSLDYFPTPSDVAAEMAAMLPDAAPATLLEPSAGEGALLAAALDRYPNGLRITAIEFDAKRAAVLREKFAGATVVQGDFLSWTPNGALFDAVVMNPPYTGTTWRKHLLRALQLLHAGGTLVAVLPSSASTDARLQEALADDAIESSAFRGLGAGAFASAGTNVNTTILRVTKAALPKTTGAVDPNFARWQRMFSEAQVQIDAATNEGVKTKLTNLREMIASRLVAVSGTSDIELWAVNVRARAIQRANEGQWDLAEAVAAVLVAGGISVDLPYPEPSAPTAPPMTAPHLVAWAMDANDDADLSGTYRTGLSEFVGGYSFVQVHIEDGKLNEQAARWREMDPAAFVTLDADYQSWKAEVDAEEKKASDDDAKIVAQGLTDPQPLEVCKGIAALSETGGQLFLDGAGFGCIAADRGFTGGLLDGVPYVHVTGVYIENGDGTVIEVIAADVAAQLDAWVRAGLVTLSPLPAVPTEADPNVEEPEPVPELPPVEPPPSALTFDDFIQREALAVTTRWAKEDTDEGILPSITGQPEPDAGVYHEAMGRGWRVSWLTETTTVEVRLWPEANEHRAKVVASVSTAGYAATYTHEASYPLTSLVAGVPLTTILGSALSDARLARQATAAMSEAGAMRALQAANEDLDAETGVPVRIVVAFDDALDAVLRAAYNANRTDEVPFLLP